MPSRTVLAIDPGRGKCGLAVVRGHGAIECLEVVPTDRLADRLGPIVAAWNPDVVVLGSGTGHQPVLQTLKQCLPATTIQLVPEAFTTLAARELYFERNPPRGWRRLVPRFLLLPYGEMDGYAAAVLALRFLAHPAEARSA